MKGNPFPSALAAVSAALLGWLAVPLEATTITVVPVYEPLSLHGTDGDEAISETGEALQAAVHARPMAMTGAFPEVLVEAVRTPHAIPTNNPEYKVREANLLVLCEVGISAEMTEEGLLVRLDVARLSIPPEVDLTSRQVLRLAIVALRKTLEDYQAPQVGPLAVTVEVAGADAGRASLRDLGATFSVGPAEAGN